MIERGALAIGDGYRAKNSELFGDGPLFLRSGRVSDGQIAFDGDERFDSSRLVALALKVGRPGDTVVTTKGNSTGVVAFVPHDAPAFVYSPHLSFWRARDPTVITPGFIRYWARSSEFKNQLRGFAGSTDMAPYLSLTDQRRLRITLPPPVEQRRIAAVLGALDDKIEQNRRLAASLDAISEALFVELLAASGAAWSVVRLSDVADVNRASHSARSHPEEIDYVDIASVSPREILEVRHLRYDDAPSRARRIVRSGDTLVSTVRPERRAMVFIPNALGSLTASTGFAVVTPRDIAPSFLYRMVTSDSCIDRLAAVASGSAYPAVNPNVLADWRFQLPPDRGTAYEDVAGPIERLRWHLLDQNTRLAATRDTLLHKLASGQLRVPESYDPDDVLRTLPEESAAGV
ncbi:MAG: hypothetical protein M3P18_11070 [Actinomycetota bacterium]|nr:hypothetical protein [Actinomycetota bacterium]